MKMSTKIVVPGVIGLAAFAGMAGSMIGSLGVNAATASTASTTAATTTTSTSADTPPDQQDPSKGGHTANGVTETVLTGDTSTKAIAAAQAAEPGATVERAETDAEGAAYEVHMKKTDGSEVTVKLDANFKVTGTESGRGGPQGGSTTTN